MGIIYSNACFLLEARKQGASFERTLTLGRQTLYLSPRDVRRLGASSGRALNPAAFSYNEVADGLLKQLLDAREVESLDYSDFEGATLIHDMNVPIDSEKHEQFDAIIDGGTLEHVFNFPVAIANCMQLLRRGGSIFIHSQANNHMGHGFYQFSPELFFRIFGSDNGFEIRSAVLVEHRFPGVELGRPRSYWDVVDPEKLQERVGLVTKSPVGIMVHAVRVEVKPLFARPPIQSDYAARYQNSNVVGPGITTTPSLARLLRRRTFSKLPSFLRHFVIGMHQLRTYSFRNPRFYRRRKPF